MEERKIEEMNIYEKLLKITNEIGVVEKGLKIDVTKTRSYKAVSERDVLDAIKPLEEKYRVFSYPKDRKIIDKDTLTKETDYGTTTSLFMRVETTYRFVNIDNPEDFVETTVYGDGIDTGDKAPGKAMTYADKYALMKAYKLSTGDDPDKEASPEKGYKKKELTPYDIQNESMSEEQLQIIAGLKPELKEKLRDTYKKDPTTLTKLEAESAIKSLKKHGLLEE